MSIAYAVRHPERVSRLILCGGFAKGWRRRDAPADVARAEASVTLVREGWGRGQSGVTPDVHVAHRARRDPRGDAVVNELERVSASADTAVRLLHVLGDIDVMELLPSSRRSHPRRAQPRRCARAVRARFDSGAGDSQRPPGGAGEQESPDPRARGRVAAIHRGNLCFAWTWKGDATS